MNFKKISEIFKKGPTVETGKRSEWGNSGSFPALGKVPALPTVPSVNIPPGMPRVPEPNIEAVQQSNEIIKSVSPKA